MVIVIANIDLSEIKLFFKKASISTILEAYLFYILSFLARAVRWRIMGVDESIPTLFSVVAVHTLSNNVYPARTGELSFLYLLKNHSKARLSSILFSARVADMLCIALFISASLIYVTVSKGVLSLTWMLIAVVFALLALFMVLGMKAKRVLPERVRTFVEEFIRNIKEEVKNTPKIMAVSLAVWAVKFYAFYLLTKAILESLRYSTSFWEAVFGVSFAELTTVLPLHSIGGIGSFETGWAGAYMLLGFPREIAFTTGLTFHLCLLAFSIATGLPFLLLRARRD